MALPTLQKTWAFNVNNQVLTTGTTLGTHRAVIRAIKNALIGFAATPWTVRYSCDGVVAGAAGDLVDRWDSDSDLVWANAGSAHSWIVLRQTGISATFELLIDTGSTSSANLTIETSTSGFTGGSTTARPTSTETANILTASSWSSASDVSHRWNVWKSTDGECTRIALGYGGNFTFCLIVDKLNAPTSGFTVPYVVFSPYGAGGLTAASFVSTFSFNGKIRHASLTGSVSMTSEGIGNLFATEANIGHIANEIDNSWDMWPIGAACVTAGIRGRHGNFFDLWFVSNSRASSDMIPADGSNQFAVFKPLIFPWNGSAAPAFS